MSLVKNRLFKYTKEGESLNVTKFPLQSRHMLLRRQGHDGVFSSNSHRLLQLSEADGFPSREAHDAKRKACRRTRSRDSPFDKRGKRLSDILRRTACCGPRGAGPR